MALGSRFVQWENINARLPLALRASFNLERCPGPRGYVHARSSPILLALVALTPTISCCATLTIGLHPFSRWRLAFPCHANFVAGGIAFVFL